MRELGRPTRSFAMEYHSVGWHTIFALYQKARIYCSGCWDSGSICRLSSHNLLALCLNLVATEKPFYWCHVYIKSHDWVEDTIFQRPLRNDGNTCCFFNCHCFNVHTVCLSIHSALFSPVPDWWHANECFWLLLAQTSFVLAYYWNHLTSCWASKLIFGIATSKSFACALVFYFFQQFSVALLEIVVTLGVLRKFVHWDYYAVSSNYCWVPLFWKGGTAQQSEWLWTHA